VKMAARAPAMELIRTSSISQMVQCAEYRGVLNRNLGILFVVSLRASTFGTPVKGRLTSLMFLHFRLTYC